MLQKNYLLGRSYLFASVSFPFNFNDFIWTLRPEIFLRRSDRLLPFSERVDKDKRLLHFSVFKLPNYVEGNVNFCSSKFASGLTGASLSRKPGQILQISIIRLQCHRKSNKCQCENLFPQLSQALCSGEHEIWLQLFSSDKQLFPASCWYGKVCIVPRFHVSADLEADGVRTFHSPPLATPASAKLRR